MPHLCECCELCAVLHVHCHISMVTDRKVTWKHPKSLIFLLAHLAVHFKADSAVQRKQKSDHPKYFYLLCCAKISTFTYKKHEKNVCSDFNSERANQPDDPKSEPNLPSDQKVDFSQNWVPGVWVLPRRLLIERP